MVSTSRLGAFICCCALTALGALAACSKTSDDLPENGAGSAAESGGAAGDGGEVALGGGSGATAGADDSSAAGKSDEYPGVEGDAECRSGQTRCHGQLGFQRCTPDGVWGAAQSCGGYSDNGTSSYCAVVDEGGGPWAACIDPACWWWLQSGVKLGEGQAGVCVGPDKVRPCQASSLSIPEQCEGVCRRVAEIDGRELGYCDASCAEGERECIGGPLYRECVAGRWSTQAKTCDGGAACMPVGSSAHPDVACGGACAPGTSRCTEDGASVERCSDARSWEGTACLLGRCVHSGAQAQCQTECKPGERACAFDGADAQLVCGERGLWGALEVCEAGTSCRLGTLGALGCRQCAGPDTFGGNSWGVADSHCEAGGVARCGAGDTYAAVEPCGAAQSCVELKRGAAVLAYCK